MNDEFDLFRKVLENTNSNHSIFAATNDNPPLISKEEFKSDSKPIILIIDDDQNVREALKITLGKKYNTILCKNGEEGIANTNSNVFAAILDIKMEGKNGFETFTEIKKKNLYLPIIFHSAYQDIKNPFEIMNDYRPFGYVIKGTEGKELLHTIESAIDYYWQINKNAILLNKIQRQEEQYKTLVNNLNVGVYRNTGGSQGKFLQANPALAHIMGYDSVEDIMSRSASEFHENSADRLKFAKMIEDNGFCQDFELKLLKKDRSPIWVSISAKAHKDDSGALLWIDGILNDFTEAKRAEEQLQTLMLDISLLNLNLEQKVKERTSELNNTLITIREDLSVAKKIQQNTLFTNFSLIEELTIVPRYIPMSEVGGDFYGITKVKDFTYRIFIADATGHGVQAAMITMAIKGIYDDIKQYDLAVHTIMEIFNSEFIAKYYSLNSLLTALIIDIDVKNHSLKYASAGHPPAVLLQDSKINLLKPTGKMLGVVNNATYQSNTMTFHPGDRLFIFTDGIFEEFNSRDQEFGEEKLYSILLENRKLSLEETIQDAINKLDTFLEGKEKQDDITMIGIEHKS